MTQKRISLELLRVIALCMVIYNHTGGNGYEMFRTTYGTWLWYLAMFLDIISKAGVYIFFMISGALLLGKDESIKDIITRRILRYVTIIVVFSFIYYVHLYFKHPEYGFSIKYFITYIYSTPFIIPYWFLYSYLSFLIILPVLRSITGLLKEREYVFILGFSMILWFAPVWEKILKLEPIALKSGLEPIFVFYPIFGYAIANVFSEKMFSRKIRFIVLVAFILNWICSIGMSVIEYNESGELSGVNIEKFAYVSSIAIFYFIIYVCEKREIRIQSRIEGIIKYLGGTTFCTYLFEDMLRSDLFLRLFDIVSGNISKLLMCIPYTLCIIVSGVIISAVLKKIPGFKLLKL